MLERFELLVGDYRVQAIIENAGFSKAAILVHGFMGNMKGPGGVFDKLSVVLQKRGFAVCRFSFRGTPPSDMGFESMTVETETEDLKAVVKYVKQRYKHIFILGESMGGSIIANSGLAYDAAVFWYAAFDFEDTSFRNYLTSESRKKLKEEGFIVESGFKVGKQFVDDIPKIKLYEKMSKVAYPCLFLHDDNDSDVPYSRSKKTFNMSERDLNNKDIRIIKGAMHGFKNEQEKAIMLTVEFLDKFLS